MQFPISDVGVRYTLISKTGVHDRQERGNGCWELSAIESHSWTLTSVSCRALQKQHDRDSRKIVRGVEGEWELDRLINYYFRRYYMLDEMYHSGVAASEIVAFIAQYQSRVCMRNLVLVVSGSRRSAGGNVGVAWSM